MRERRFLVENLDAARIELSGRQRHHAADVLRLAVGAEATLFDGRGREAHARVIHVSADRISFELVESPREVATSDLSLVLAVATPKGSRADWLVEKCAEFGVARLLFIESQRGEVHPGRGKLERWRRKAEEAAKQSGSPRIMRIESGATIDGICGAIGPASRIVFGATDGSGMPIHASMSALNDGNRNFDEIVCVIGPEGGLTGDEAGALIKCGAIPITLGRSILRVETAAIAVAAVWAGFAETSAPASGLD